MTDDERLRERQNLREKRKKKKKTKKKLTVILAVILVVVIALVGGGYGVFNHYFSMLNNGTDIENIDPDSDEFYEEDDNGNYEEFEGLDEEIRKNLLNMGANSDLYSTDAFNIMLLGVDSRGENFSGRSDAMILFSINKNTKKVTMTSFLRDIYASIPGYGNTRLNAAYAYGGMNLMKEAFKSNFGITIDRCVVVNFKLVADFVDAVGGVDLDLSAAEIKVMNNYIKSHNTLWGYPSGTDIISESSAGTFHANGNQALAYARVRYVGTDFARTGRQRTIINKCFEKVKTMNFKQISDLVETFLPKVRTDLTQGDVAALLLQLPSAPNYEIQTMVVPADGTYQFVTVRGMSVISIDFAANSQMWHELVEDDSE